MKSLVLAPAAVGALLAACLIIATGCATAPKRGRPEQPLLRAQAAWLDGAVEVTALLTPPIRPGGHGGEGPGGSGARHGRPGGAGGDLEGEEMGGGPRHGGAHGDRTGGMRAGLPPLTHRLAISFTNRSAETIAFRIDAVESLLGNVAIHPDRVSLAPGQTVELDPILASIGGFFEELDVTITLRREATPATVRLALRRPAASE